MTDREKVIKGIKCHRKKLQTKKAISCLECPYSEPKPIREWCMSGLMDDIYALLKEQETADTGSCRVFQCKKCGYGIDDIFVNDEEKYQINPRYCPYCGRKVKRDG